MSILKSNSATIVNEPITEKWLKTTCFYDQIIPSRLLKVRSGGYCILCKGRKYPVSMFSIANIFAPPNSHWSYKWVGVNGSLNIMRKVVGDGALSALSTDRGLVFNPCKISF